MDVINLPISVSANKVLNSDLTTAFRTLRVIQNESYQVNLRFLSGSAAVTPAIDEFTLLIRNNAGTDFVLVDSIATQPGTYPYYFTFDLTSPALAAALTTDYTDLKGIISWSENTSLEVIEPFTVRIARAASGVGSTDYVSSLNGLSDAIILEGGGSVSVSVAGQTITVYGASSTGGISGDYVTNGVFLASGNALQSQITTLNNASGSYYSNSNPSGFINNIPVDVVRTTGTQTVNGFKTFGNQTTFSDRILTPLVSDVTQTNRVDLASARLYFGENYSLDWSAHSLVDETNTISLNWNARQLSGDWFTNSVPTENAHLINKGFADATYATRAALGASGNALQGQITALQGQTGSYYLASNPAGYITSAALAPYATAANLTATGQTLLAADSDLQSQINVLESQTGDYYQASNPAGYITSAALTPYATTASLNASGDYLLDLIQASSAGVSALNGQSGIMTITGAGSVTVSTNGQTITVSGAASSGGTVPTGIVFVTGNQTIHGNKTFVNSATFSEAVYTPTVGDISQTNRVSLDTAQLYVGENYTLEWSTSRLIDAGNTPSVNWAERQLSGDWFTNTVPSDDGHLVNKGYVDSLIATVSGGNGSVPTGRQTIWMPAASLRPATISGSVAGSVTFGHGYIETDTLDFDSASNEFAAFSVGMPRTWDVGPIRAEYLWTHGVDATGSVAWSLQAIARSDNDSLQQTFAGGVTVTDSSVSGLYQRTTAETSALNISGSPTLGDAIYFRVYRDTDNIADTLTIDAQLIGIRLKIGVTGVTE